jgi:hypothetical protein
VSFALLPYGGATGHPQTYIFPSEAELIAAAQVKERHFLDVFHSYIDVLNPRAVLPFAGQYWLGGPLAALNPYRGMPDAIAAAAEVGSGGVVLADGGHAFFDLDTMKASSVRTEPYDTAAVDHYLATLEFPGYAYERELRFDANRSLPLIPLLNAALRRARERFPIVDPCWVCLGARRRGDFLCFDVAGSDDVSTFKDQSALEHLTPRIELFIDDRYLFGLLTRLYHWNNASIGSQYHYKRIPNEFRRDIFNFLDYLQV